MSLNGTRIALLIEDEYQILEGWYPLLRLQEAGAGVSVLGSGTKGSYTSKEGYPMEVDAAAGDVSASDFDAVVVPGGFAPDNMRLHPEMIGFVRDMNESGKLVTAICHGGWVLVSAGVLGGRRPPATCRSRTTSRTPAAPGWTSRSSRTATSSRRARRSTCPTSPGRSSVTWSRTARPLLATASGSPTAATNLQDDPAGARYEVGASA